MVRTFDSISRDQLLIYAHELAQHFREKRELQHSQAALELQMWEVITASIAAQEEERQRIACEVHDRISQTLASIFQQLQLLEDLTRKDPAARQLVVRASTQMRTAIRESRNIMNDLHPPLLDEFGVVPLMEEELRHAEEGKSCLVKLESHCRIRPSPEVEIVIYRIFHEALVNIERHADTARHVTVTLSCDDYAVNLQVVDDGPGFDVAAALQRKSVGGLISMRRRAESIGGNFEVISAPGQGTRVNVGVPLPKDSLRGGCGA